MKVLGIDIGGEHAAFLLEERPKDIQQFINSKKFQPFKLKPTQEALEELMELAPDLVVFEPSGYHYEVLIEQFCKRHNIPYKRCTGTRLANYRKSLGLPKSDRHDAFSLALYALDKMGERGAFVEPCELEQLRRLWIERDNLMKLRTGMVNRLRQQLVHEFPEVSEFGSQRQRWLGPKNQLFRWLAGLPLNTKRDQTRYDTLHDGGVVRTTVYDSNGKRIPNKWQRITRSPTYGTGVSAYSRLLGKMLSELEDKVEANERAMIGWLQKPEFASYQRAFDKFGFSNSLRVILLSRIYPFERFLDDKQQPITTKRISNRGKTVTKHVSLGQFKACLGAGQMPNTSGLRGERTTKHFLRSKRNRSSRTQEAPEKLPMGDRLSRKNFFMWAVRSIEGKNLRKKKELPQYAEMLIGKSAELKAKGKNIYQRCGTLYGFCLRHLFRELVKEVIINSNET